MSLTGNLEDLPLLDILQIVSFSRKTGYLTISTREGDSAIVFENGVVVASFTAETLPIDERLAAQPPDRRASMIRRRIEVSLQTLIRLREGQFSFSLTESAPSTVGGRDIRAETLEGGLNVQELLLELARGMDEDRRDSAAVLEASFVETAREAVEAPETPPASEPAPLETLSLEPVEPPPATPEPPAAAEPFAPMPAYTMPAIRLEELLKKMPPAAIAAMRAVPPPAFAEEPAPAPVSGPGPTPAPPASPRVDMPPVLLVDDEDDVRVALAGHITRAGYQVVEAADPEAAVKTAGRLGKDGVAFMLVTDLGMPTSGGSSFQGGFEVVKRLWKMKLHPPVLMMTERLSPAVRTRARQMGIAGLVFKPGLSKLDPEQFQADLEAFADKLSRDLLPRLSRAGGAAKVPLPRPASRPRVPARGAAEEPGRQVQILGAHLQELRQTSEPTQISGLVMKLARAFFERGALFLVKNEQVRGLAGFGPVASGENINLVIRELVVPLGEPSVFLDVVSTCRSWAGSLSDARWNQHLMSKLGRLRAPATAVLPLLAHRETIAILLGDNPETGRPLPQLDALEVFMNQAGIAMENTMLQRKLRALEGRAPSGP